MKILNPDSQKIPIIARQYPSEPNQWTRAHYDPNSIKQQEIRGWFRDALISFEAQPASVQQAWDDFYYADKGRLPSSGIGYATLYIYCKKRGYDTYFQEWSSLINGTWNLGENHLPHFFESADNYLYFRTWQKLNDAFHKTLTIPYSFTGGCLSGTVYLNLQPIQSATIEVYENEEMKYSGTSQADGSYDVPLVKGGSYDVVFNHPQAIAPVTIEDITIVELQSTNQDGYLEP